MIKVEKLSYSFPDKDLYQEISFSIEEGQHAVLIGSNGSGKTTLLKLLLQPEDYLYDGKIRKNDALSTGYVSQYVRHEKEEAGTVFEFLSRDFVAMQEEQDRLCAEMAETDQMDEVMDRYQASLDRFEAVDGYNYETNIHLQLKRAGLSHLENVSTARISGGEYKLLQVIRQMLQFPGLLVMDEPDVFLDFDNLKGLRELINSHKGTLLVVTHNRYLLNHCFDKVLHLEGSDLQEFDGSYMEYNLNLLRMKIEMQEAVEKETAWIEIQEKLVEKLRAEATRITNPAKGRLLKGRATYLERLKNTRTREPFVDLRIPQITLPAPEQEEGQEPQTLLALEDYSLAFDRKLLEHVSFEVREGEKVVLAGPNGTGKTSLLREIRLQALGTASNPTIHMAPEARPAFLSQLYGEMLKEENTLSQEMEACGFELPQEAAAYLKNYCFEEEALNKKIAVLSGGEKNLLQLAEIALGDANLLILDEPTSHLDTWSQIALEDAIRAYPGAVLMVSHDFYTITGAADRILYVEEGSVRSMSGRAFRKMIYREHFDKDYLELEQQKKELELKVQSLLARQNFREAREVCDRLEDVITKMK